VKVAGTLDPMSLVAAVRTPRLVGRRGGE